MDRLFQSLRPFIRWVVAHAVAVLAVAALLSAGGFWAARQLTIDTDFANLIPEEYPSVQALERLRETVGGESAMAVAIQSPSFEANAAFAEALVPQALELEDDAGAPFLTRAEFRRDTEFLQQNALYFATGAELDSLNAYLDDRIREATEEANPFFFDLDDELFEDEEAEEPAEAEADPAADFDETYNRLVGRELDVSPDSTTLVVRFYPAGSQTNIAFIERLYEAVGLLIEDLEPETFHPEMEVTTAGRLLRQAVEVRAITGDVAQSFGAGALLVLLTVVLYFLYKSYQARAGRGFDGAAFWPALARTPVLALVIGLPLAMSLLWTFGVAFLAFETLNLMTSTLGLVLFGLGIDFGIHFYARYTEERAAGHGVAEATEATFVSTGQAIAVGALTTAAALYVLVFADFRGFSEFGFIAGTGILFALVAMLVVLPAFVAVMERLRLLNLESRTGDAGLAPLFGRRVPGAKGLVIGSLVAVVAALVLLPRVSFEYRFGELEPVYTAYEMRQDRVRLTETGDNDRRNPAYIVTETPEEVPAIATVLRERMAADTLSPTILDVETLQERFPNTAEAQQQKLQRIAEIRARLDEPAVAAQDDEDLRKLRAAASTTDPIALDEVPEFLRAQYTSKTGAVGNFVIIYPSVGLSDARQSVAFAEDVGAVTIGDETYYAGSTSLVAADMIELMQQEAPWMVLATFLIVALLMGLNFRSVRWAALALVPLVVGVLWMLLLMEVFGLRLNFYNLVVLPAVLGIGNDAGVHLVHRYREEGLRSIRHVLRSTGEHVAMGSITTMIGFGGLLLSFHPGLESIGQLAVTGIGTTLLAALLFLPALLQWLEDRNLTPADHAA